MTKHNTINIQQVLLTTVMINTYSIPLFIHLLFSAVKVRSIDILIYNKRK